MSDWSEPDRGVFWIYRLEAAVPLPYPVTFGLYGLLVAALMLAHASWLGATEEIGWRPLFQIPLFVFTFTASVPMITRAVFRCLDDLGPALRPGAPTDAVRERLRRPPPVFVWSAGAVMVALSLALSEAATGTVSSFAEASERDRYLLVWRAALLAHGHVWGLAIVTVRTLRDFVQEWAAPRVHTTRDLRPVGRLGITWTFLIAMPLTIQFVTAAIEGGVEPSDALYNLGVSSLVMILIALTSLAPVLPARRRIRALKRQELSRTEEAIRQEEPLRVMGREIEGFELLEYREVVSRIPEWPFDTPTLRWIGLFIILPLLSWVAAALVEMGIEAVTSGGP